MLKAIEEDKQWALGMLRTWLKQRGKDKAKLEGREKTRTVGMVKSTRYNVDHKKLNALLDPETRAASSPRTSPSTCGSARATLTLCCGARHGAASPYRKRPRLRQPQITN